jgi:hypothetical protein
MRRTSKDLLRAAGVRDIVAMAINSHLDEGTQAHYSTVSPFLRIFTRDRSSRRPPPKYTQDRGPREDAQASLRPEGEGSFRLRSASPTVRI